jgi:uncharacterized protein DUF1579
MEMPKPGPEHQKLAQLAGSWEGEETLHPSPWDPAGGSAKGRYRYEMALEGFYLIGDYEQQRDAEVTFRGHAVIGWNAPHHHYAMYWFDSTGFLPSVPATGPWKDDILVLSHEDPMGHHQYVFHVRDGEFDMRIENSPDGNQWTTFMEGTYRRK